MNIYAGLLFQQGFIQDPALARSLAGYAPADDRDGIPAASLPGARNVASVSHCKPSRFGAIVDACSVALSPFR